MSPTRHVVSPKILTVPVSVLEIEPLILEFQQGVVGSGKKTVWEFVLELENMIPMERAVDEKRSAAWASVMALTDLTGSMSAVSCHKSIATKCAMAQVKPIIRCQCQGAVSQDSKTAAENAMVPS